MRIEGGFRTNAPAGTSARPASADGRFTLPAEGRGGQAAPASAARMAHGVDMLLALQTADIAGERRRRAVQRGRSLLDALDLLKAALLNGRTDDSALARLRDLVGETRISTGEGGLDEVLEAVELRAQVELAKRSLPEAR